LHPLVELGVRHAERLAVLQQQFADADRTVQEVQRHFDDKAQQVGAALMLALPKAKTLDDTAAHVSSARDQLLAMEADRGAQAKQAKEQRDAAELHLDMLFKETDRATKQVLGSAR
jgi:hypothetical protein